jgi:hypothetical protein
MLRHFSNGMRAAQVRFLPTTRPPRASQPILLQLRRDDALMDILGSFTSLFRPRDEDAVPVGLTKAQQTNVPSRSRLRGSMPSTRLGATTCSKPAEPPRKTKPKNYTQGFLNKHDHVAQDPIEVPKIYAFFHTCALP